MTGAAGSKVDVERSSRVFAEDSGHPTRIPIRKGTRLFVKHGGSRRVLGSIGSSPIKFIRGPTARIAAALLAESYQLRKARVVGNDKETGVGFEMYFGHHGRVLRWACTRAPQDDGRTQRATKEDD
jgi:hypothetical protein